MAGIGFKLQKLLDEGTYFGVLKGFLFATFLIAGPWIVTVIVISLLNHFTRLQGNQYDILKTSIVYVYAFSLLLTGFYQMPLTRYLADELYAGRIESLVPSFLGMTMVVATVQGVVGFGYSLLLPLSWFYRYTFMGGMVIVGLLWLAGIYLSCLRDFEIIGVLYIVGAILSLCFSLMFQKKFGLEGAFFGFIFGHALILMGLTFRILRELGLPGLMPSFVCLKSLVNYPDHLLAGLLYNMAIWVDKFLYWMSDYRQYPCRGLYSFGIYDTAIFLAYVTIIPALGIFLMNVETEFYLVYRKFYGAIIRQLSFRKIVESREDIKRVLMFTFFEMVKVQGALTLVVYYFAPEILRKIHYVPELLSTLRWGVWGAFFQALFLFVSLVLLYFEFAREALWANFTFFAVNALLTGLIIHFRLDDYLAAGYVISTIMAFMQAVYFLRRGLRDLIFITFSRQPIPHEIPPAPPRVGKDGRLGEIVMIRSAIGADLINCIIPESALEEKAKK
ncbi:MAG: exopolysaccharide Pel transporter PelG [Candidatus Riflebacteria bacterium]|nr:exopolysaccharide Pel transporter PelG [Candidatus Riflebacteria bacterium]